MNIHDLRGLHLRGLLIAVWFAMPGLAQYTVVDLGTLGGPNIQPHSINKEGQVAGVASLDHVNSRGFRTAPNRPINPATDILPTLGGTFSSANSINGSGQMAGNSSDAIGILHAVRFDADGTIHDLGSLGVLNSTHARAINDSGQITGESEVPSSIGTCSSPFHDPAFRTAPGSPINPVTDSLGTLLGGNCGYSDGYAINSSGVVVGASLAVVPTEQHAMLASPDSAMNDLGVLGGSTISAIRTAIANAINDSGQIAGESTYNHDASIDTFASHAFFTTAAGPMQDLGTLGGTSSRALAINSVGQIVGTANLAGDVIVHPFLYDVRTSTMVDLTELIPKGSGWLLTNATAINDNGQIVGQGLHNGVIAGFRLDPPAVAVSNVIDQLSNPALGLSRGEIASLSAKLEVAKESIEKGNKGAAVNQLEAFVNEVQGRRIASAADVLETVKAIIASLQ